LTPKRDFIVPATGASRNKKASLVPQRHNIAVIGLGYVGLPVAVAFARAGAKVVGFDIDRERVEELCAGFDRTREVEKSQLSQPTLVYTCEPESLAQADFFIVTVPTPIDALRRPELSAVFRACETVGRYLKRGGIVVFESTLYPGAVEEDCAPVLERASGLRCGHDFTLGYSPERINPGDREHRFETITKVVAGQDEETLRIIAETYGGVVKAGIHRAPSIKVAEAAKVIENTQRDLNIAFMNELSALFDRLGIDTGDVLAAAGTKWNFQKFTPGLVGGHCIGVDPYYLTHRAQRAGYEPQVILAGRKINDSVGQRIARECIRRLLRRKNGAAAVTILGMTFKENVPDTRNSKVADIIDELRSYGLAVQVCDPLADRQEVKREYGFDLTLAEALEPADAVIFAVAHEPFVRGGWPLVTKLLKSGGGVVLDVKSQLDRAQCPSCIELWRL
jgi:UDP-N-acetyl-D-glucosamine/UDP-N-acetyl-D-galactosamine dehydrogenase